MSHFNQYDQNQEDQQRFRISRYSTLDGALNFPSNNVQHGPGQMPFQQPAQTPPVPMAPGSVAHHHPGGAPQYPDLDQWEMPPAPSLQIARSPSTAPGQHQYHPGFGAQHPQPAAGPPPPSHTSAPNPAGRQCSRCHTTETPLWRRDPLTHAPLCNACGLYLQQRHAHRPMELIYADRDDGGTASAPTDGRRCSHCGVHRTTVWRRNREGDQVCNACGVYERLHKVQRPLSLTKRGGTPSSPEPLAFFLEQNDPRSSHIQPMNLPIYLDTLIFVCFDSPIRDSSLTFTTCYNFAPDSPTSFYRRIDW
ncbi:hypothetical protein FB45DRAFT_214132 [Roridomyces roridus]|uniref:GATA-type domain-containing protein n=1 Tax=Roridomyces roridus TaxID=1738132 RepID=A0AAD7BDM2_9AGAR|nr:hypothetical protein FB45DRAFT_214132 [Roridomyces roridus]